MRVLALLFAMFFCGVGAAELKIASFNVQNLFDGVNDGTEYADFEIGRGGWSEQKYERKLQKVADEINALNADILGLQEIENEAVLKALAQKAGYSFYKFSRAQTAPVGIAVLSRVPVKSWEFYRAQELKTRDILRADFALGRGDFSLYVVHMLSARNPLSERKKNFRFLNEILKGQKNAVVVGDFNTNFGKNSLLSELVRQHGFADLWALHPCSRLKLYGSCASHESGSALDHILLSDDLFGAAKIGYKNRSYEAQSSSSASDHFPISFVLTDEQDEILKTAPEKTAFLSGGAKDERADDERAAGAEKISSVDEIYGRTGFDAPVILKGAVVTFLNNHGFAISQNRRGVFVYGDAEGLGLGDMLDIRVKKAKFYKQNFEIYDFDILAKSANVGSLASYVVEPGELEKLRAGDTVSAIRGDVKDGEIDIKNFGKFRIFSKKSLVQNGKNLEFKNAYFTIYKGQREFIVE